MNKDVYRLLADQGRNGDTELAHITKEESNILRSLGGAGTINPETGLSEYHGKWGMSKKKHPRHHTLLEALNPLEHIPAGGGESVWGKIEEGVSDVGEYISEGYDYWTSEALEWGLDLMTTEGTPKTEAEIQAELNERQQLEAGKTLLSDPSGQTIGEMGLGQEALTAEQYQGMTPQEIVDDIFAKQYNNTVPPDMLNEGVTVEKFKTMLAGQLQNMPQFKGVDPEALGFVEEAKDIAIEQTNIAAQKGAKQVGGARMGAYGGMGAGMRAGVGGATDLTKTYGLGLETADLGFRKGVYGLEEAAASTWETDYTSFLGTLPSAA